MESTFADLMGQSVRSRFRAPNHNFVNPLPGMLGVLVTFFIHRETDKIFVDSHKTYSGPGGGISKENFVKIDVIIFKVKNNLEIL